MLNTKLIGPLFELFIDSFTIVGAGVPPECASASTLDDLADFLGQPHLRSASEPASNIESRLDVDLEAVVEYFIDRTGECNLNELLERIEGSYFMLRLQSNPQFYGLAPHQITQRRATEAPEWTLTAAEINNFVNELLEEAVGGLVVADGVATR